MRYCLADLPRVLSVCFCFFQKKLTLYLYEKGVAPYYISFRWLFKFFFLLWAAQILNIRNLNILCRRLPGLFQFKSLPYLSFWNCVIEKNLCMHGAVLCYITNGHLVTGIYTRTQHGCTLVTHPNNSIRHNLSTFSGAVTMETEAVWCSIGWENPFRLSR